MMAYARALVTGARSSAHRKRTSCRKHISLRGATLRPTQQRCLMNRCLGPAKRFASLGWCCEGPSLTLPTRTHKLSSVMSRSISSPKRWLPALLLGVICEGVSKAGYLTYCFGHFHWTGLYVGISLSGAGVAQHSFCHLVARHSFDDCSDGVAQCVA